MEHQNKVDIEDLILDYDEKGNSFYSYEGLPFSGMAYEYFPNGSIRSEGLYENGLEMPEIKEWNASGQLIFMQQRIGENKVRTQEWYPNGQAMSDSLHEFGVCIHEKRWDESGQKLHDFEITEDDQDYDFLIKMRNSQLQ